MVNVILRSIYFFHILIESNLISDKIFDAAIPAAGLYQQENLNSQFDKSRISLVSTGKGLSSSSVMFLSHLHDPNLTALFDGSLRVGRFPSRSGW